MAESQDLSQFLPSEKRIAGPFSLFNDSFIIEYFQPDPSRNASALMKGRFVAKHPEVKLGKKYAQSPPLHLHFWQIETFVVLQGRLGNTLGWDLKDRVFTAKDGIQTVPRWTPHSFWPVPPDRDPDTADLAEVDPILMVWSHPKLPSVNGMGVFPPNLDDMIFQSMLGYISDMHEGKARLDLPLIMLQQQETETTLVWLPSWWLLGPLRWWIPYTLQSFFAMIARWQGKVSLIEKHVGSDKFAQYAHVRGKPKTI